MVLIGKTVIGFQIIVSFCYRLAFLYEDIKTVHCFQRYLLLKILNGVSSGAQVRCPSLGQQQNAEKEKMSLDTTSEKPRVHFYYINASEIPGELSRVNMISSAVFGNHRQSSEISGKCM